MVSIGQEPGESLASSRRLTFRWNPSTVEFLSRYLAATVLLVAAALKWYRLFFFPDPSGGWWTLAGQLAPVFIEIVLAFALLFEVRLAVALWSTVALFVAFAGFNLTRILSGYASCGCFGLLSVSPWITLTIDLVLAGLLTLALRQQRPTTGLPARPVVVAMLVIVVPLLGSVGVSAVGAASSQASAVDVIGEHEARLNPAGWVGRRWPLFPYVRSEERLDVGEWLIVLYNDSCGACRRHLAEHQRVSAVPVKGPRHKIAYIDVAPPGTGDDSGWARPSPALVRGSLDFSRHWGVKTPTEIHLIDGRVSSVN